MSPPQQLSLQNAPPIARAPRELSTSTTPGRCAHSRTRCACASSACSASTVRSRSVHSCGRPGAASGSVSYHLATLAKHGFAAPSPEFERDGRERWWRAAHESTSWRTAEFLDDPDRREAPRPGVVPCSRPTTASSVEALEAEVALEPGVGRGIRFERRGLRSSPSRSSAATPAPTSRPCARSGGSAAGSRARARARCAGSPTCSPGPNHDRRPASRAHPRAVRRAVLLARRQRDRARRHPDHRAGADGLAARGGRRGRLRDRPAGHRRHVRRGARRPVRLPRLEHRGGCRERTRRHRDPGAERHGRPPRSACCSRSCSWADCSIRPATPRRPRSCPTSRSLARMPLARAVGSAVRRAAHRVDGRRGGRGRALVALLGPVPALVVDAAGFVVSALLVACFVPVSPPRTTVTTAAASRKGATGGLVAGIRFIARQSAAPGHRAARDAHERDRRRRHDGAEAGLRDARCCTTPRCSASWSDASRRAHSPVRRCSAPSGTATRGG